MTSLAVQVGSPEFKSAPHGWQWGQVFRYMHSAFSRSKSLGRRASECRVETSYPLPGFKISHSGATRGRFREMEAVTQAESPSNIVACSTQGD
ncbi:hypothetical protein PG990_004067 [Apiospora arundinis]